MGCSIASLGGCVNRENRVAVRCVSFTRGLWCSRRNIGGQRANDLFKALPLLFQFLGLRKWRAHFLAQFWQFALGALGGLARELGRRIEISWAHSGGQFFQRPCHRLRDIGCTVHRGAHGRCADGAALAVNQRQFSVVRNHDDAGLTLACASVSRM